MKIGTRSVLYGVHSFWLHPFQIAYAWWTLYGFPWDPRLWFAFFLHDIGYIGKPDMDGEEGEHHVELGAELMSDMFDPREAWGDLKGTAPGGISWFYFTLLHSRFYAKREGQPPSRLCFADKLVFCQTPWWLYRSLSNWSGEIDEYMKLRDPESKYAHIKLYTANQKEWFDSGVNYTRLWIKEHFHGKQDEWTQVQTTSLKEETLDGEVKR